MRSGSGIGIGIGIGFAFGFAPWLLLAPRPLSAQTWTAEPSARAALHSVYINSDKPVAEDEALVPVAGAQLKVNYQKTKVLWSLDLDTEGGLAQNDNDYHKEAMDTRVTLRGKHRASTFLVQIRNLQGYDPLQEKIELALAQRRTDFRSQILGVYHEENLGLADTINLYAGLGNNQENDLLIQSSDIHLGWEHRYTELWLQRARLRKTSQRIEDTAPLQQWEASVEENYFWTRHLVSEILLGYSQQSQGDQNDSAAIGTLALTYRDTAALFLAGSASLQSPSLRDITPEELQNLRGSSLYTLGWSRSRESRQQGDAVFYSDQIFAKALMTLQAAHRIEAEIASSDAPGRVNLDANRGYASKEGRLAYHWIHRLGLGPAASEGDLGFRYSSEKLDLRPTEYFRETYSLFYQFRW